MTPHQTTELLVCVTCRAAGDGPGDTRAGRRLFDALAAAQPDGLRLRPVECLQNCDAGCTVALRGGDVRWTYVYGNLSPADAQVLLDGARLYHGTADGLIPWRERPEHFKRNCVARIPPRDFLEPVLEKAE